MVRDGSVRLDDPVAKYLPASVHVPSRNGKVDHAAEPRHAALRLAAHAVEPRRGSSDPYAHYTKQKLYAFLNGYKLTRDPGASFEYSNLGVGLLGVALANRAHTSYAALLRAARPRAARNERHLVEAPASGPALFAAPHTMEGDAANNWHFDALAPAGGITSTVADMLKYVRCNMGQGPLAATCLFAQQPRDTIPGNHIGLIWWTGDTRGHRPPRRRHAGLSRRRRDLARSHARIGRACERRHAGRRRRRPRVRRHGDRRAQTHRRRTIPPCSTRTSERTSTRTARSTSSRATAVSSMRSSRGKRPFVSTRPARIVSCTMWSMRSSTSRGMRRARSTRSCSTRTARPSRSCAPG